MASLFIGKGAHGVNKLHIVRASSTSKRIIVFFVGDSIQAHGLDPAINELQEPKKVCTLLASKCGNEANNCSVVVVQPSHYEACCAVYKNFFDKLTLTGEPLGYNGRSYKASEQLHSLLQQAGLYPDSSDGGNVNQSQPPITDVIGFSKGGILINQLLAEVAAFSTDPSPPASAPLLQSLRQFHYLDAGLNCRGAYLTDPESFMKLGTWSRRRKDFAIVLHGTPRQWADVNRPHIKAERDRMVKLCEQYGVPITVEKYFEGLKPSLKMHFEVIHQFKV